MPRIEWIAVSSRMSGRTRKQKHLTGRIFVWIRQGLVLNWWCVPKITVGSFIMNWLAVSG